MGFLFLERCAGLPPVTEIDHATSGGAGRLKHKGTVPNPENRDSHGQKSDWEFFEKEGAETRAVRGH